MTQQGMRQQGSTPGDAADGASDVTVDEVRFEHHRDSFGIGEAQPRLSWIVDTTTVGWRQTSYEIEAYKSEGQLRDRTGRVESDQSVLVSWPFAPLSSRERLTVRVRVWGIDGRSSAWSKPSPVEAGLLHADDWTAQFVTSDWEEDSSRSRPGPLLRREFDVRTGVRRARLYVTALGVYEAQLNGATVGDHVLDPGWTSYDHRLRYQTFDVTGLLREGRNVLGAMLGADSASMVGGITSMATDWRCWPSSRSTTRMARASASSPIRPGDLSGDRSWPAISMMARRTMLAWNCLDGRCRAMTTTTGWECDR